MISSPLRHRRAEMRRAADRIALVQIVRPHPHQQQLVHELPHRLHVVVHALEQHGLRAERNAGVGQPGTGLGRFRRALVRMDEVQAHPDRMVPPQHAAQLARDPLRQHGRHLRADADELDVRNRPQLAENPLELVVAQRQRIAAGDQHVANLRRAAQIIERRHQPALLRHQLAVADHARPRAVAAVRRAEIERQQQHAIRVAMHQARHRAVRIFAQRIVGLALGPHELIERRHDGPPQRLQRIVGIQQAHVVRRDADRQHRAALHERFALLVGQPQHLFELRRACGCDAAIASASRSTRDW